MSVAKSEQSIGFLFLRALVPIVILVGGVAAFIAISSEFKREPPLAEETLSVPTPKLAAVHKHSGGMTIIADGVVVPYREIEISAEVPGRIEKRASICRAGNYVKQGQLLVTIDRRDYQLEVDRLEEEVRQATVALKELDEQIEGIGRLVKIAQADLALRQTEFARLKDTIRTAVSLSDLERVEGAKLAAENTLETLKNRALLLNVGVARLESARDLAQLKLSKARLDLDRTEIFAPADGVIVADFVEEDSYVQPGTPLLTLEDTAKAEVKCKLQMEDLYWIWDRKDSSARSADPTSNDVAKEVTPEEAYDIPDVEVDVVYRLAGHNDIEYVWSGWLKRYDGLGLDEKTRTVPCRVVVDNPLRSLEDQKTRSGPPALMRGMYVAVRAKVAPETTLLRIPESAVRPGNKVWCVRDIRVEELDGQKRVFGTLTIEPINFVTLLGQPGDEGRQALIYVEESSQPDELSPLTEKDQVVTDPLAFVRSGMKIELHQDAEKHVSEKHVGEKASR